MSKVPKMLPPRIGRFTITKHVIDEDPDLVMAIMGTCIIYRAEYMLSQDVMSYEAYNVDFDELKAGEAPPDYVAQFTETDQEITLNWVRVGK